MEFFELLLLTNPGEIPQTPHHVGEPLPSEQIPTSASPLSTIFSDRSLSKSMGSVGLTHSTAATKKQPLRLTLLLSRSCRQTDAGLLENENMRAAKPNRLCLGYFTAPIHLGPGQSHRY
jgi:hypothetical protein